MDAVTDVGGGLNCQNFQCPAGKYYNGSNSMPHNNTGAACVDCATDDSTCAYNEYGQNVCTGAAQGISRMTGALSCATCSNNNSIPINANSSLYSSTHGDASNCSFQCSLGDWYDSDGNSCTTCTQATCLGGEYRQNTCTAGVMLDNPCVACTNLAGTNYSTAAAGSTFDNATSCATFTCDVGMFFNGVSCTACETDPSIGCSGVSQGPTGTYLFNQCTSVRESSISFNNVCTAKCSNVPSGVETVGHSAELDDGNACTWKCPINTYHDGGSPGNCVACNDGDCAMGEYREAQCNVTSNTRKTDNVCQPCNNRPANNSAYTSIGIQGDAGNCSWLCSADHFYAGDDCVACAASCAYTGSQWKEYRNGSCTQTTNGQSDLDYTCTSCVAPNLHENFDAWSFDGTVDQPALEINPVAIHNNSLIGYCNFNCSANYFYADASNTDIMGLTGGIPACYPCTFSSSCGIGNALLGVCSGDPYSPSDYGCDACLNKPANGLYTFVSIALAGTDLCEYRCDSSVSNDPDDMNRGFSSQSYRRGYYSKWVDQDPTEIILVGDSTAADTNTIGEPTSTNATDCLLCDTLDECYVQTVTSFAQAGILKEVMEAYYLTGTCMHASKTSCTACTNKPGGYDALSHSFYTSSSIVVGLSACLWECMPGYVARPGGNNCDPLPSSMPTSQPSSQPSGEPSAIPSAIPTGRPSSTPSGAPSTQPSSSPSSAPSGQPTGEPTGAPTGEPSGLPSGEPTGAPTGAPTGEPSGLPSGEPTSAPSGQPSSQPSGEPTAIPSGEPTGQPTGEPTGEPSGQPTGEPSGAPSSQPTGEPTSIPSGEPTSAPTGEPTGEPTGQPTGQPSGQPSTVPSCVPSSVPSTVPSNLPTSRPSDLSRRNETMPPSSAPTSSPTNSANTEWETSLQNLHTSQESLTLNSPDSSATTNTFERIHLGANGEDVVRGTCQDWRFFMLGNSRDMAQSTKWKGSSLLMASRSGNPREDSINDTVELCRGPAVLELIAALFPDDGSTDSKTATDVLCEDTYWSTQSCFKGGEAMQGLCVSATADNCAVDLCAGDAARNVGLGAERWVSPCSEYESLLEFDQWRMGSAGEMLPPKGLIHALTIGYDRDLTSQPAAMQDTWVAANRTSAIATVRINTTADAGMPSLAGTLYCDAYPIGSPAPATPGVIADAERMAAIGRSDGSGVVDVQINVTNLLPSTDYTLYCACESEDGVMSSPDAVNTTGSFAGSSFRTDFGKTVDVRVLGKTVGLKQTIYKAVEIAIEAPPSDEVTFKVQLRERFSGELRNILFPSLVTFDKRDSALTRSLGIRTQEDVEQTTYVHVEVSGPSADEFDVSFVLYDSPLPVVVDVVQTAPPAPKITSAQFSADGTSILVLFDSVTDVGGMLSHDLEGEFRCDLLLSFSRSSDAAYSKCRWQDSASILIFPRGHYTPSGTVSVSETVFLLDGSYELRAHCESKSFSQADCSDFSASTMGQADGVEISPPFFTVVPTVSIAAPAILYNTGGSGLSIDLSGSSGSGGRGWETISITAISPDEAAAAVVTEFISGNVFRTGLVSGLEANVPVITFAADQDYTFMVEMCNFLTMCGRATHRVLVMNGTASAQELGAAYSPPPTVRVAGKAVRVVDAGAPFLLSADAFVSTLDDNNVEVHVTTGMSFVWTVRENGLNRNDIRSTSRNPLKFQLPANVLRFGSEYTVRLTALHVTSYRSGSAEVRVKVPTATIVPVVRGGLDHTISRNDLYLDASASYDEGRGEEDLQFRWECSLIEPTIDGSACGVTIRGRDQALPNARATPRRDMGDTVSRVTLTVFDSQRSEKVHLTVRVAATVEEGSFAPEVLLARTPTVRKMDVGSKLVLNAKVQHTASADVEWHISPHMDLEVLSPSRISQLVSMPESAVGAEHTLTTKFVNLVIPAHTLLPRQTFTFTLLAMDASNNTIFTQSSMEVVTNGAPQPGRFTVSPTTGVEFTTVFDLHASLWEDEDLPLTYSFTYQDPRDERELVRLPLKTRDARSRYLTKAPAGFADNDFELQVFVNIFDAFSAFSSATVAITVEEDDDNVDANFVESEVRGFMEAASAADGDSFDVNAAKSTVSRASSFMNRVSCSTSASRNCGTLKRLKCSKGVVPDTCGACVYGYFGQNGPANTPCVDEATWLVRSSPDPLALQHKACPGNCFGGGNCTFVSADSLAPIRADRECFIGDVTCEAVCACVTGFGGKFCQFTDADASRRRAARGEMVLLELQAMSFEGDVAGNIDKDEFEARAATLASLGKNPDDFTYSSRELYLAAVMTTLQMALDKGFSVEDADGLVAATDYCMDLIKVNASSSGYADGVTTVRRIAKLSNRLAMNDPEVGEAAPVGHLGTDIRSEVQAFDADQASPTAGDVTTAVDLLLPKSFNERIRDLERTDGSSGMGAGMKMNGPKQGEGELRLALSEVNALTYGIDMKKKLYANPLRLEMKEKGGHDGVCTSYFGSVQEKTITFTVPHAAQQIFDAPYGGSYHEVVCGERDISTKYVSCGNDLEDIVVECTGAVEPYVVEVQCQMKLQQPRCDMLAEEVDWDGLAATETLDPARAGGCEIDLDASDPLQTTCVCNLCNSPQMYGYGTTKYHNNPRRQLGAAGDAAEFGGTVELVAMSSYVVNDFGRSFSKLTELGDGGLWEEALVIYIFFIVIFGGVFATVMLSELIHANRRNMAEKLARRRKKQEQRRRHKAGRGGIGRKVKPSKQSGGSAEMKAALQAKLYKGLDKHGKKKSDDKEYLDKMIFQYVGSFFPGTFSDDIGHRRLGRELMDHQMLSMIFSGDSLVNRLAAAGYLVTTVALSSALVAFLLALQYPSDDGECETFGGQAACEEVVSMFDSDESKCAWFREVPDEKREGCEWKEPDFSVVVVARVLVIVVMVTGPMYGFVNFIFDNVFRAPTAQQVDQEKSVLVMMRRFVVGMGRNMRHSIASMGRRGGINMSSGGDMLGEDGSFSGYGDSISGEGSMSSVGGSIVSVGGSLSGSTRRSAAAPGSFGSSMSSGRGSMGSTGGGGSGMAQGGFDQDGMGSAYFWMDTRLMPAEFKIATRVGVEAAVEKLHIDLPTQLAYARHVHMKKRIEVDLQRKVRDKTASKTRRTSISDAIVRRMSTVVNRTTNDYDDVITINTNGNHVSETLQNLFKLLVRELEADMTVYRRTLSPDRKQAFDRQWGIWYQTDTPRFSRDTVKVQSKDFVARRVAYALSTARDKVEEISSMPEHHAGAELMRLFCMDLLGTDTPKGGTFRRKYESEFERTKVLSMEFKVCVAVAMALINVFLVMICVGYGATKGSKWQNSWLGLCLFKSAFDVLVKRFTQAVIIGFAVPNLILSEVRSIKANLRRSARRLAKDNADFKLDKFSATDYTFASSLLAKQMPHLLESKIILMYRDAMPERLMQNYHKKNGRRTLLQTATFALVVLLLHFGALSEGVKKLVVHIIPSLFFVLITFGLVMAKEDPSAFALVVSLLTVFFVLPMVYYFHRVMNETGEIESQAKRSSNAQSMMAGMSFMAPSSKGQVDSKAKFDTEACWVDSDDDDSDDETSFSPPKDWREDAQAVLRVSAAAFGCSGAGRNSDDEAKGDVPLPFIGGRGPPVLVAVAPATATASAPAHVSEPIVSAPIVSLPTASANLDEARGTEKVVNEGDAVLAKETEADAALGRVDTRGWSDDDSVDEKAEVRGAKSTAVDAINNSEDEGGATRVVRRKARKKAAPMKSKSRKNLKKEKSTRMVESAADAAAAAVSLAQSTGIDDTHAVSSSVVPVPQKEAPGAPAFAHANAFNGSMSDDSDLDSETRAVTDGVVGLSMAAGNVNGVLSPAPRGIRAMLDSETEDDETAGPVRVRRSIERGKSGRKC